MAYVYKQIIKKRKVSMGEDKYTYINVCMYICEKQLLIGYGGERIG